MHPPQHKPLNGTAQTFYTPNSNLVSLDLNPSQQQTFSNVINMDARNMFNYQPFDQKSTYANPQNMFAVQTPVNGQVNGAINVPMTASMTASMNGTIHG